jgi:hypothetical protein
MSLPDSSIERPSARRRLIVLIIAGLSLVGGVKLFLHVSGLVEIPWWSRIRGRATVADRLAAVGPDARTRLAPFFAAAHVSYPPARVVLVGLKREKKLQLYAAPADGALRFIRTYPVIAMGGRPGPKLREGDGQTPEGLYGIDSLNPNSQYHLSLRVNYPNALDREHAEAEHRTNLGGDIMIHGSIGSAGCLAMGDRVSEDLFVLAADTGRSHVAVILSPVDFRRADLPPEIVQPMLAHHPWVADLYGSIRRALAELPRDSNR